MKYPTTMTLFCMALIACSSAFGYSNPVEGGTTETVTNDWYVAVPWLMVGSNSGNNSLKVVEGGQVFNQIGSLGNSVNSSCNSALVSGNGSIWNNSLELSIGYMGASNALTVSSGGAVITPSTYVGYISDGNFATVTGSNSLLETTILNVGYQGDSNGLMVMDSGAMESETGTIGYWIGSDNNIATVQSNGVWNSSVELNVGDCGSANRLSVLAGGQVDSPVVNVGVQVISSNNVVSVSGSGALLNASELNIGGTAAVAGGTGNRIEVSGGGRIETTDLTIHAGNNFDLNDGGTFAVKNDFDASMEGFNWNDGGHLSVFGNLTGLPSAALPHNRAVLDGYNRILTLDRGSLNLGADQSLSIGHDGDRNSLILTNGGTVNVSGFFVVGNNDTSKDNKVLVSGAGSRLSAGNKLSIGYDGASGNVMEITAGGKVSCDGGFVGALYHADNNRVVVTGDGSRWMSSDHVGVGGFGSRNKMVITNGGSVVGQVGYVGYGSGADDNSVLVTDAGSIWQSYDALYIGGHKSGGSWVDGGTGNSLTVSNASWVFVGDVNTNNLPNIGTSGGLVVSDVSGSAELIAANQSVVDTGYAYIGGSGTVTLTGNSEMMIRDSLYVGYAGTGSELNITDGGLLSVGRDVFNQNGSYVTVSPDSRVSIAGDYFQDETSSLRFGVETNTIGAPLNALVRVGGTAEFETGAKLEYASNVGQLEFDKFYTNKLVEANLLIVGGVTNANSLDLEKLNASGSLVDVLFWENDQDIYALVGRKYLTDSSEFDPDSMMGRLTKEIDDLSLMGNATAIGMINLLNTMSGEQQSAQLVQLYAQGAPTYMHSKILSEGQQQILAQGRAFRAGVQSGVVEEGKDLSGGEEAKSSYRNEHGMRGWMRSYGSWANHEEVLSLGGFEQSVHGTIVGIDKAYGNVLVGAAGGYARSSLNQDNHDSSDAKTRFGILYASLAGAEWFWDINLSYGRSRIETRSGTVFGANGESDADNYTAYVGGGRVFNLFDNGVEFTPEAGLFSAYFDQENYSDGFRDIDAYNRWSYQSRAGAALALRKQIGLAVVKPELHVYWLHEFNSEADDIGYSLVGGTGRYAFSMQAPEQDVFEGGAGITAVFNDRVELALSVDGQYGEHHEAVRVSGGISVEL